MKRRGPSTEPWGTPWETGAVLELDLLTLMNWWRCDLNQGSASDAEGGLKVGEEDGVVDGVKGCTEVEEDKDVEGVIIRGEEEFVTLIRVVSIRLMGQYTRPRYHYRY